MDFFKVLKDPDINRAITFGFSFLKAFGQGLEKNRINEKVMGSSHHFFHYMYKSVHVKRNILLLKRWIRTGNMESISNIVLECGGIYATP